MIILSITTLKSRTFTNRGDLCYNENMLSVIIPTHNELSSNYIQKSFKLLAEIDNIEVIIVDSSSTDGTRELAEKYSFRLIDTHSNSRAGRLNTGIESSKGDMILLHHPRSILTIEGITYLRDHTEKLTWGAFTHKFDEKHLLFTFTSWYSNYIRGDQRSIFYLDHCIFAKNDLLKSVGLIPDVDIFEDTEICLKLRKLSKQTRLPFISMTSAIRFKTNGLFKQSYKNQLLKWKYYFNSDHKKMNKNYEQGLDLNSKYENKK